MEKSVTFKTIDYINDYYKDKCAMTAQKAVLLCIDIVLSSILDKTIWNKNRGMDYFTLYLFQFHFSIRKGRFLKNVVWQSGSGGW